MFSVKPVPVSEVLHLKFIFLVGRRVISAYTKAPLPPLVIGLPVPNSLALSSVRVEALELLVSRRSSFILVEYDIVRVLIIRASSHPVADGTTKVSVYHHIREVD